MFKKKDNYDLKNWKTFWLSGSHGIMRVAYPPKNLKEDTEKVSLFRLVRTIKMKIKNRFSK